jgi:hypothetical protein
MNIENLKIEDIFPNRAKVYKICAIVSLISLAIIIFASYSVI